MPSPPNSAVPGGANPIATARSPSRASDGFRNKLAIVAEPPDRAGPKHQVATSTMDPPRR